METMRRGYGGDDGLLGLGARPEAERPAEVRARPRSLVMRMSGRTGYSATGERWAEFSDNVAPRSAEAAYRKDLKGDTEWLLLVASAYARHARRAADDAPPEPVGAWDHD